MGEHGHLERYRLCRNLSEVGCAVNFIALYSLVILVTINDSTSGGLQKSPVPESSYYRHKRYEKMTQRCGTHSPKAVVFRYTRQWSNLICSSCMHLRVRGPRTNHEAAKGQRIFKLKKRGAGWSKHPILKAHGTTWSS